MSTETEDLQAPVLLMAMPQVLDPFFHQTVILLLHHTEEGSFGFIVNRPTEIEISEILDGMEISWNGDQSQKAFFGGPVQSHLGTVMFSDEDRPLADSMLETSTEICAGIRITQHLGDLDKLAAEPPGLFRLFLGYSGWGAGQLLDEIIRNDWMTAPVKGELVFPPAPELSWEAALESIGIEPAVLPSWTQDGDDQEAN